MGFLDKAIKNGLGNAIGNAIGSAVNQTVERTVAPRVEQAAANVLQQTANAVQQSVAQNVPAPTPQMQYPQNAPSPEMIQQATGALGGLFGSLQNMATEVAKNMKVCPACGEAAPGDTAFCPSCGGAMPQQTIGQGAICSACGNQNHIGTTFCAACGTKLPSAVAEEKAMLLQWDQLVPQYPKWCCGGSDMRIENAGTDDYGNPFYLLEVRNTNPAALDQYRQLLRQNGFREAGQYPSSSQLYKKIGGICYCFSSEDAFVGDAGCLNAYFCFHEPPGGFDYVKPEPQKPDNGLFSLFK